jgi:mycothiol system anti-sigma-R factor
MGTRLVDPNDGSVGRALASSLPYGENVHGVDASAGQPILMTSPTPPGHSRHAPCATVRTSVYEFLDEELAAQSCQDIVAHLALCGDCATFVEGERRFLAAVERCSCLQQAPATLRERIRATLEGREDSQRRQS